MVAAITISCPKSTILQNPTSLKDPNSSFLRVSLKGVPFRLKPRNKRTDNFCLVVAAASNTPTTTSTRSSSSGGGRFYLNFTGFPFLLCPFFNRRTIRTEAVKGLYMAIRTRTSIRLQQCVNKHSNDSHQTQIWRIMGPRTHCSNGGVYSGIGPYVEVAFYHKRSRTLLVTDAVIFVPRKPPEYISKESLLASARNGLAVKILSKGKEVPQEPVFDNQMNRQKGWERMVLQILFLVPSNLLEPNGSFAQMSQKLIVSPIVKTLVFSKVPEKVRDWIDSIFRDWKFKRIIPAHFAAPINAGRSEFLAAFAFLDDLSGERYVIRPSLSLLFASIMGKAASYFPPDDMKTLSSLDQFLVSVGAVKKTVSGRKKTCMKDKFSQSVSPP